MDKAFRNLLKRDYVIFDGAMGTMLQAAGMKLGETPEVLNVTNPELLVSIHEKYLNAGLNVQGMQDGTCKKIKVVQENWTPIHFG